MNADLHIFEGRALRVREWQGRPCVEARELATVLQYRDTSDMLEMVTGPKSEFIEGADYVKLTGDELTAWKNDIPVTGGDVDRTARLVILFEPGMYLAAIKARTEVGKRVRRWLAEKVLPSIARTGQYIDATRVTALEARVQQQALQLAELSSAFIGARTAEMKIRAPLARIASLYSSDKKVADRTRRSYEKRLRNFLGFNELGSRWPRLNRVLLHAAEYQLAVWLDEAIAHAKRNPPGQPPLPHT